MIPLWGYQSLYPPSLVAPPPLMSESGRTRPGLVLLFCPPSPIRHSDGTQCQRHPSLPFTNTLLSSLPSLVAAGRPRHGISICAQRSLLYLHTLHIKGPFVMRSAHMTVRLSPCWKKRSLSSAIQPHPQHQSQPHPSTPTPPDFCLRRERVRYIQRLILAELCRIEAAIRRERFPRCCSLPPFLFLTSLFSWSVFFPFRSPGVLVCTHWEASTRFSICHAEIWMCSRFCCLPSFLQSLTFKGH